MSVNLQGIHRTILEYLESEISEREGYLQREVQLLHEIENNEQLSPKSARELHSELREVRDRSTAHEKLLFYLAETSPLLEEFSRLLSTPIVKRSFMSRRSLKKRERATKSQNADLLKRKQEITTEFLRIAHQYSGTDVELPVYETNGSEFPSESEEVICEECGGTNVVINVSNSMACCYDCACEFTSVADVTDAVAVTTVSDDTRGNSRYEAILHFRSSMAKYQGKQQTNIPVNLYEHLHAEFARAGLLSDFARGMSFDELREISQRESRCKSGVMDRLIHPENMPESTKIVPYKGAYARITHDHIIMFLREGFEKHYEDVMLIHYCLTGVPPPNIGNLEPILEQDFKELMGLYHQEYVIKRNPVLEDGKSFKSNYYILYKLLQKHNVSCNRKHFSNMLKTPDREIFYDMVCSDLFSRLGWNFRSEF